MRYPSSLIGLFQVAFLAGTVTAAADGNTIYLLQDNPTPSVGNSIFADQSAATGSLIAGDLTGQSPASQTGSGNSADIFVEGTNMFVVLAQGSSLAPGNFNVATILASGASSVALLEQSGSGNTSEIIVDGIQSLGAVGQFGDGNDGTLRVSGNSNSGQLIQRGDNNQTSLQVDGAGSNVTYELVGSGVSNVGNGPQVFTNAGTVEITHTVVGAP